VSVDKPVAIGSDDAGYRLKGLIGVVQEDGLEVADFGCHSEDPIDYPDVAFEVANAVARGEHDRGILICGTGDRHVHRGEQGSCSPGGPGARRLLRRARPYVE
jgi:hypothetical protein